MPNIFDRPLRHITPPGGNTSPGLGFGRELPKKIMAQPSIQSAQLKATRENPDMNDVWECVESELCYTIVAKSAGGDSGSCYVEILEGH